MKTHTLETLIKTGINDAEVYVEGDGTHFTALVISPAFDGKSRIARQQLVYDTVKQELLSGNLHALSIKALTPEEYERID